MTKLEYQAKATAAVTNHPHREEILRLLKEQLVDDTYKVLQD